MTRFKKVKLCTGNYLEWLLILKSKALPNLFCVVKQVESNLDIAVAKSVDADDEAANNKVI